MDWPIIAGLGVVAIALLYSFRARRRAGVDVDYTRLRLCRAGLVPGVAGLCVLANNFGSSDATYSSIGAVIILLTWMNVIGRFILIGGEINAQIALAAPAGKEPGEKQLSAL